MTAHAEPGVGRALPVVSSQSTRRAPGSASVMVDSSGDSSVEGCGRAISSFAVRPVSAVLMLVAGW